MVSSLLALLVWVAGARAQEPAQAEPLPADPAAVEEIEVVAASAAEELEASAQAVHVVETEQAARQSADLAEVMAREQGISVRRTGSLGSDVVLSLNGFSGDQIRLFLDELPLHLAGYPLGLGTVPVGAVEWVEIYRGVVPVRFGADALGGAVNIVSPPIEPGVGGSVSYQGGSFDTHRATGVLQVADPDVGWRARAEAYVDASANDYTVDVEVPDAQGRLQPATVRRFHDRYDAIGGNLVLGAYNRRWVEALTARVFGAAVQQQLQSNFTMTEPYGEAESDVRTFGAVLSYRHTVVPRWTVRAVAGTTWTNTAFVDLAACVYDWFGQCVRPRDKPGELSTGGTDEEVDDREIVGRLHVGWTPASAHAFTLSVAPTWFTRSGVDHLNEPGTPDPQAAVRSSLQVVSGLEHRLTAWEDRLENLVFGKAYLQHVQGEEEEAFGGGIVSEERRTLRGGVGDGLRLQVGSVLRIKASYEYATRLPTPVEQFGDGVRTQSNLELVPETSHNLNLGFSLAGDSRAGETALGVEGFARDAHDLILLLGTDTFLRNHNVFSARALGAEAAARWTSPGEWVTVDANGTFLDFRNTSTEGTFQDFEGDRIPNRPWLFANLALQLGASGVAAAGDRLSLDWYTRYVHAFYRGWESVGIEEYKQVIPAQLTHTVAATYVVTAGRREISSSLEVQNVTDADAYDYYGVQLAGRAVFGKVSVTF